MPKTLLERVEVVAQRMNLSRQDVMRLAMDTGLEHLKRCNYDLASAINKVAQWLGDTLAVAEDTYGHLVPQDAEINAAWIQGSRAN